ncbi:MAG TPA: hypothetical protein VHO94_02845 [Oscillospiraceae bacterium]|nr:hypothetical protein [Oscillospiraceae bacterium]
MYDDEEKKQLQIINQNIAAVVRNQALLYCEINSIKDSLKILQETDKAENREIVNA